LTTAEKLQAMEALWADLSRDETQFQSPGWHEEVLKERACRVEAGEEAFIDWSVDKQQLRERHR
jgi:hypothetical protein